MLYREAVAESERAQREARTKGLFVPGRPWLIAEGRTIELTTGREVLPDAADALFGFLKDPKALAKRLRADLTGRRREVALQLALARR